jgi:hypothetical protein
MRGPLGCIIIITFSLKHTTKSDSKLELSIQKGHLNYKLRHSLPAYRLSALVSVYSFSTMLLRGKFVVIFSLPRYRASEVLGVV